jgi:hypothetical protein
MPKFKGSSLAIRQVKPSNGAGKNLETRPRRKDVRQAVVKESFSSNV